MYDKNCISIISKHIVSKHCRNTYILVVRKLNLKYSIVKMKDKTFIMYPNVTIEEIVQICLVVTIAHVAF